MPEYAQVAAGHGIDKVTPKANSRYHVRKVPTGWAVLCIESAPPREWCVFVLEFKSNADAMAETATKDRDMAERIRGKA